MKPLSWSEMSAFEQDFNEWYVSYVLGVKRPSSPAMERGKDIHDFLQTKRRTGWEEKYTSRDVRIHETILQEFESKVAYLGGVSMETEKEALVDVRGVPTKGFWDGYKSLSNTIIEIKTGADLWTEERAKEHGQLTFYAAQAKAMKFDNPNFILFSASTKNGKCATHVFKIPDAQVTAMEERIERNFKSFGKYAELRK